MKCISLIVLHNVLVIAPASTGVFYCPKTSISLQYRSYYEKPTFKATLQEKKANMNLKDYLKKNKKTIRGFAKEIKISHYAMHRYVHNRKPAPRQAWRIFNSTDGMVSFFDMGYDAPPKNPLKDI